MRARAHVCVWCVCTGVGRQQLRSLASDQARGEPGPCSGRPMGAAEGGLGRARVAAYQHRAQWGDERVRSCVRRHTTRNKALGLVGSPACLPLLHPPMDTGRASTCQENEKLTVRVCDGPRKWKGKQRNPKRACVSGVCPSSCASSFSLCLSLFPHLPTHSQTRIPLSCPTPVSRSRHTGRRSLLQLAAKSALRGASPSALQVVDGVLPRHSFFAYPPPHFLMYDARSEPFRNKLDCLST